MPELTFYHAPHSRSFGTLVLLEELDVPFHLHALNMKAGEQRQPAYLAINPMGKVPAIRDGGALVTEQGAIFIYLADLFPEKGLAPAIGDPLRGPYLRWLGLLRLCLRARRRRQGPEAGAGQSRHDALWRLRHDAEDPDGPARPGSLSARRKVQRRRRALGHGPELDRHVQSRAGYARDPRLYRPHNVAPGLCQGAGHGTWP